MEYFAGDGLALKVGDRVTKVANTPSYKHAYYLIEGVVLEKNFCREENGHPTCLVRFEDASEESYKMTDRCCLVAHLVHLENIPDLSTPEFENVFNAILGLNKQLPGLSA